jgi:cell division protein FtsI/penicillin-binding protein 2
LTLRQEQVAAYDFSEFGEAVLSQSATMPLAPTREFARALLGTAGDATAEIVEASQGAIAGGDTVGLSGLQRTFDERLRGQPGAALRIQTPGDEPGIELASVPPVDGEDVVLSLNQATQTAADNTLATTQARAALVAVRPSTGAVLAVGNSPATEGVDLALTGQYPPGSVFKLVTALAMLRTGMTDSSQVSCPASLTVDGRVFTNYDDYPASRRGTITLRDAFAYSCNTAFLGAAQAVGQEALAAAANDLGLGVGLGLGVDAFPGSVPLDADGTEHAAEMIGQGQVVVSPVAMAVAAASVAAGARITPRLVTTPEIPASDYAAAPSALTAEEAGVLASLMRTAVTSGTAEMLAPLGDLGAKTGTAEYGTESPPRTHAWMVAIDPEFDIAVAVLVEDGGSGSATAGPLVEGFLDRLRQSADASPEVPE